MGSRPLNRTPGGQDAVPRPSCCAFPCCCSSSASCWSERCRVPQLPILWRKQPGRLPCASCERRPRCSHPQHHPRADSVLAAAQVAQSPAAFPVTTVNGENVAPGYNTVPAQTAAHENHLLIAQQQQLQQLID